MKRLPGRPAPFAVTLVVAFAACERTPIEPIASQPAIAPPLFSLTGGASGAERQITTDPVSQMDPAIGGDRIVWSDLRNGNRDIHLLEALINQVNAQIGKKITADDAAVLMANAERIRATLGC